jgi:ABC-type phosphate transport system substrate-binding protein
VSGGNGTGPPAQIKQPISVLAPPSSLPFVEKWVAQYNNGKHAATVRVDYTGEVDHISIGPVYSNVSDFLGRHLADMAIAGRPAQQGSNFTSGGSQFLPVSPQAIAVVYNVPGFPDVPSGLKLDPPTLARILGGNITRWDAPAIKGLDPGTNLPNEKIVVVHERRDDSATALLSEYLSNVAAWPKDSQAADSADSLSTIVRQTPYSIGYVDFSYAVQTRMTYAALKNSGGEFVAPSTDSVGAAIRNGTVAVGPQPPATAVGRLGAGSYPIVGFYYAAFGPVNATSGKAAAVLDFVRWIADKEGQQVLADMQYPSVYEQDRALKTMAASLTNGTAAQNVTRFENATDITKTSGDSVYGQVAADGDGVYVA